MLQSAYRECCLYEYRERLPVPIPLVRVPVIVGSTTILGRFVAKSITVILVPTCTYLLVPTYIVRIGGKVGSTRQLVST